MFWCVVQQFVFAHEMFLTYKLLNVTDKGELLMVYEPPTVLSTQRL